MLLQALHVYQTGYIKEQCISKTKSSYLYRRKSTRRLFMHQYLKVDFSISLYFLRATFF